MTARRGRGRARASVGVGPSMHTTSCMDSTLKVSESHTISLKLACKRARKHNKVTNPIRLGMLFANVNVTEPNCTWNRSEGCFGIEHLAAFPMRQSWRENPQSSKKFFFKKQPFSVSSGNTITHAKARTLGCPTHTVHG